MRTKLYVINKALFIKKYNDNLIMKREVYKWTILKYTSTL